MFHWLMAQERFKNLKIVIRLRKQVTKVSMICNTAISVAESSYLFLLIGTERVPRDNRRDRFVRFLGKAIPHGGTGRQDQYRYSMNHGLLISIIETICRRRSPVMTGDICSNGLAPVCITLAAT